MNFDQLIKFAVEQNASDLHFQTGAAPLLRINGQIRNVESPPLTNEVMRQFILSLRPKMTADELDLQLVQRLPVAVLGHVGVREGLAHTVSANRS